MALVDYSESESEGEPSPQPEPKPSTSAAASTSKPKAPTGKKPFQKVVDRANPGKIIVNLPQASNSQEDEGPAVDEPPAKRAKTSGGGLFSGLNSFLPPPKNPTKTFGGGGGGGAISKSSSGGGPSRPIFQLKTSSEAGFSREAPTEADAGTADNGTGGATAGESGQKLRFPPPKAAQPSIPESMKPEEEVKLVGKPMMFKPLSVARNKKPKKAQNKTASTVPSQANTVGQADGAGLVNAASSAAEIEPPQKPKKMSLFSIEDDSFQPVPETGPSSTPSSTVYEPLFETNHQQAQQLHPQPQYQTYQTHPTPHAAESQDPNTLTSIANDLNLSLAARRELFGRQSASSSSSSSSMNNITASKVVNFNMDTEYQHNEALRASGQQVTHNPVRAIAPGKHSLRQLVNSVQNQREALEESFAKGRSKQNEASGRYGWR